MENANMLGSFNNEKAKSISHALTILNEAAKDSSDEIRQMVSKDFRRIKETFSEHVPEVKGALREIRDASGESVIHLRDRAVDSAKETARRVDETAHSNPWIFIGATAAVLGVLGFVLGRRSSH